MSELLNTNLFVSVYGLDFSKAFDIVLYTTLLEKMAMLDVPDNVYNWFVDFLLATLTVHTSKVNNLTFSRLLQALYKVLDSGQPHVVNAVDLVPKYNTNTLIKYADDTYLVVPAGSISTRQDELHNIEQWSLANNLKLNRTKSLEIIFVDNRRKHSTQLPAELTDIKRVDSINILGVTVTNTLTVNEHVDRVLSNSAHAVSICVKDIASTRSKPRVSTKRIQRCNFGKTNVRC